MKVFQKNKDNLTIQFDTSNNQMEIYEFDDDPIVTINGKSVLGDTAGMTEFKYEDEIEIDDSMYVQITDEFPLGGFSSNITVVFDGIEYPNIPKTTYPGLSGLVTYGAPPDDEGFDYSVYPFVVEFDINDEDYQEVFINTKYPGSHTISITGFYGEQHEQIVIKMKYEWDASESNFVPTFIDDMESPDMMLLGERLLRFEKSYKDIKLEFYTDSDGIVKTGEANIISQHLNRDIVHLHFIDAGEPILCFGGLANLIYDTDRGWNIWPSTVE